MEKLKVTVVTPTYNEAANLPDLVRALLGLGIRGLEILVVDDGSPDGTGALAEELARAHPGKIQVLHRQGKQGLASAYVAGFKRALEDGADVIVEMDADLSHSPHDVSHLLDKLKDHDVVVGSRYASGGQTDPRWGWKRRLLSWAGNAYARWVTGLRVKEATGGFKAFRREALEKLDLERIESKGYAFQVEVACACQKQGLRVVEVPILFRERSTGRSKMSWSIIWEAFWRVWRARWRY
ncbi:MAG: polyprenol monophosphomannose synthase [Chloroflexi bacterium]|nr:polyprenol monophosphomannose synthase [Chloroflexota bacterium]